MDNFPSEIITIWKQLLCAISYNKYDTNIIKTKISIKFQTYHFLFQKVEHFYFF